MAGGPRASSPAALARFKAQRRRDTKPEVALRRELHRRGLRFFIDRAPLPGNRRRADIVFPRLKLAVYVDGCFWHACPVHATNPKQNGEWWAAKLKVNVRRDRDTDEQLADSGWTAVRVWEHEDAADAAGRVESEVQRLRALG